ncbi:hypothetical protein [Mesorhizobium sp.]|uniref:hypothetical protein n=1 Tax=Mesorhizobium sp. TaxID=1871066 RepID=UPI000FE85135|nr:hypothetical protein [Mesorhizobium sp.]RWM29566.1 MAG: hypothetical protein EOR74_07795 [Mesorhizobium sp.]RWM42487.1 MAG: hypothetical protein EOR75_01050 [Mesorhizobium sp.]TIO79505.1 MAG: hypothetical protein E5X75_02900 [Mesorhizobium sp.]TIO85310.1 MAG: hypothetical protein E5X74_11670 [Mesorhizobium sp.]TJV52946.1 MAG: hypothetical protein E5Y01_07000 [Mesorhizobium sp.]
MQIAALSELAPPPEPHPPEIAIAEVSHDLSRAMERAEVNAWLDLYDAAPADFVARHGLSIARDGDLVWTTCTTIPFIHFNCVKNIGVDGPATEEQVDALLAHYRAAGILRPWFYTNPHTEPSRLRCWLEARGLQHQSGWERIFRDATPPAADPLFTADDVSVEEVMAETAPQWAAFIDGKYRLPASPWLMALVGRKGWHHYMLKRDGAVAAVRSLFIGADGSAWSGIDAPVPGIMAPSFDLDAMLGERLVRDGIAAGAKLFVADIEAPRPDRDGPAYRNYARLGFRIAYFRSHYSYLPAYSS